MSGLWVLRPEEDGSDATEMTLEQLRGRIEELEMIVEAVRKVEVVVGRMSETRPAWAADTEPKAAPRPCPRCGPGHSMETQHVCERCGHRETTDGREPVAPAADAGGEREASMASEWTAERHEEVRARCEHERQVRQYPNPMVEDLRAALDEIERLQRRNAELGEALADMLESYDVNAREIGGAVLAAIDASYLGAPDRARKLLAGRSGGKGAV